MDEPDYTMAEVALLVSRDPGMTTRFLQMVNNPVNRRACKIETVSHAVSLLGIRQVHDIVLSASVAEAFEGIQIEVMSMKKFWKQSFYCALMTKQLALECGDAASDRLFVMGLLHELGHLFMYMGIPEASQKAILNAKKSEQPLFQVEREMFGFDYAKLGGYVMQQWNLPESFQITTWFHPEPGKVNGFAMETALVHLGALLVMSELEEGDFGQGAFRVDPLVWPATGLTKEQCINCRSIVADAFDEVEGSFI